MKATLTKGSFGMLATGGGFAVAHAEINAWLTTISLLTGICVGAATLVSLIIKIKKPKDKNEQ